MTVDISLGYLLALLVTVAALALARAVTVRGRGARQPDTHSVPAEDLALIAAGPRRAALTALVSLYEADAIDIPWTWRLGVSGPLPPGSSRLATSAHRMIGTTGQPRVREVLQQLATGTELRSAQARLAAAGYLPRAGQVRLLRVLRPTLPLLILSTAAALTPLAFGAGEGMAGLMPPVAFVTALVVIALAGPTPATRDGRRLVEAARSRAAGYEDGGVPGQRAVAVALFGPAALWRADASIARRLGVGSRPQYARVGGRGGSSRGYTDPAASETPFGGIAGWFAFGGDDSHHGGWDGGWGGGGHSGGGSGGCGGGGCGCGGGCGGG